MLKPHRALRARHPFKVCEGYKARNGRRTGDQAHAGRGGVMFRTATRIRCVTKTGRGPRSRSRARALVDLEYPR